ncbi:uncharacterized protein LOC131246451 isoform X2 [Magnolia sinica]|uniref:uncharacterized protein LOC131246451 isoform X2 n=1 Tax=Magnolia sinica TaxID=86752 RepID=UPI00265B0577|nr:uncharacterized protein LOC131246451 isoform X2 [Magnolia sinica]
MASTSLLPTSKEEIRREGVGGGPRTSPQIRSYRAAARLPQVLHHRHLQGFQSLPPLRVGWVVLVADGQRMADDSLTKTSTKNNVQQDLTKWQEQHATLVLSTVKEISQLRYVLCPRHLKDGQFWRIYFALVKSYVAPYEMHAIREAKLKMKAMEDEKSMEKNACEVEMMEANSVTSTSLPASSEHDSDSLQFGGKDVETGDEVAKAGGSDKDNLRT